MKLASAAIDS